MFGLVNKDKTTKQAKSQDLLEMVSNNLEKDDK